MQDVDESDLTELGEVQAPSIADIFVALMGNVTELNGGAA